MTARDDDFAFEPVPGLPARLPEGEQLLWQGAPRWTALALSAFRLRWVAIYFALVAAWRGASTWAEGGAAGDIAASLAWTVLLAGATFAILGGLAFLYARSTVYSLTSRRVVIRSGLALPVTIDIPLALVSSASVAPAPGGTSSIALEVAPPDRIAWLALWPNARPWAFNRPQPMLRAVADAAALVPLLTTALSASAAGPIAVAAASAREVAADMTAGAVGVAA